MDLKDMLNDDGNQPLKARQSSIVSPTSSATAFQASPASTESPSRPARGPVHRRGPPNWAKRFDWDALQRGGHPPLPHIPSKNPTEVVPPRQQLTPQPPPLAAPAPIPALEPCLTGELPYDDVTRNVCDFFWQNIIAREDLLAAPPSIKIEVEGKLGTLLNRDTNQRLQLPVFSQVVLAPNSMELAFKSLMDERQHKKMNDFLNENVSTAVRQRRMIQYQHLRETDSFHLLGPDGIAKLPPVARSIMANTGHNRKPRVRVTRDTKTGALKNQIIKTRIADLDIYSPHTAFDCRISINAEITFPEDASEFEQIDEPARVKDRMSYVHQFNQIDLTQVHGSNGKVHELEIELMTDKLIEQGMLTKAGQENCYETLVGAFVNNIRLLSREAM